MGHLILMQGDPFFAFTEINKPVTDQFQDGEHIIAGY